MSFVPPKIEIAIPVIAGFEEYAELCITNLIRSSIFSKRLIFHIGIDLNNKDSKNIPERTAELKKLNQVEGPKVNVYRISTGFSRSSLSHSIVVNQLVSKFTNDIGMIMDSDTMIMQKDWDRTIVQLMGQYDIVGIPWPDNYHYQDFPSILFCAFKLPLIRKYNIDFRAENVHLPIALPYILSNNDTARIYGVREGELLKLDSGSELCSKLRTKQTVSSKIFPYFKNKCKEQLFLHDNKPFVTHLDNSSRKEDLIENLARAQEWLKSVIDWHKKSTNVDLTDLPTVLNRLVEYQTNMSPEISNIPKGVVNIPKLETPQLISE